MCSEKWGTGLKISCSLPRLYRVLSVSLSHALCHSTLTCFAPRVWVSLAMKVFERIGHSGKWQKQRVLTSISGSWRGFSVRASEKGQVWWNQNARAHDLRQLSHYFQTQTVRLEPETQRTKYLLCHVAKKQEIFSARHRESCSMCQDFYLRDTWMTVCICFFWFFALSPAATLIWTPTQI